MNANQLLMTIAGLEPPDMCTAPLTLQLENALKVGPGRGRATYRDQKHHWERWLRDYQRPDRLARRIYNSINCPPMVLWLAEAAGTERPLLEVATRAALRAPSSQAAQSAAVRREVTWGLVYRALSEGKQQ